MDALKIAIVGLDTSHSIAFSKLMNDPDCAADLKVTGMRAVSCLRFETPFQDAKGLDARQQQLESWGVKVTCCLEEALADCDAIMMEINDPAYHLEYFKKLASLGKPIFLDKPLAGSLEEGRAIIAEMRRCGTRVWSASSLPFAPGIQAAIDAVGGQVNIGHCFGALGTAPAGDSLIWYGVHSFEMLQRLMGCGARSVRALDLGPAVVSMVDYGEGRYGVIESIRNQWKYGGRVQNNKQSAFFDVDSSRIYHDLLQQIKAFFLGAEAPISMEKSFEGLAMMCAARKSIESGGVEQPLEKL
jgi:predicted dehydrogenase